MLHVKTDSGFQLPSNIFYKHGLEFAQVKKVYSNQRVLERNAFCSCELDTSMLVKSLTAYKKTLEDLKNFETDTTVLSNINSEIAELSNEIKSLKIEQVLINQQIEIIDNDNHLVNVVKAQADGLYKITETVMGTVDPIIAVKIVPGSTTFNPDIVFSPMPNNVFKFNGNYYYIGKQENQETILNEINDMFGGEGKVALEVFSSKDITELLRQNLNNSVESNIISLNKILSQQNIIDNMISSRQQLVSIDPSLETEHTDVILKKVYNVSSITSIDGTTSNNIKTATDLKINNLNPGLKIDIKSPLFPFVYESLNTKATEILGLVKVVSAVGISNVISKNELTVIYTSSDVHEFKFKYLIKSSTGVDIDENGNLVESNDMESIISEISCGSIELTNNVEISSDPNWLIQEQSCEVTELQTEHSCANKLGECATVNGNPHSMIISKKTDEVYTLLESNTISSTPHNRIITKRQDIISELSDNVKVTVKHPELITIQDVIVCDMNENVIAIASTHDKIISLSDDVVADLQENVKAINDPIPFTVYQSNIRVNTITKPILEVESVDNHGRVVKSIGSIQRINPVTVLSSKVPNYISTQNNMSDILEYSLDNTTTQSNNSHIVSMLNESDVKRLVKPIIDTSPIETYIAESRSVNIIEFGEYVTEEQLEYNVISVKETPTLSLGVVKAGTETQSSFIISNKDSNTIDFGTSSEVAYSTEVIDDIISPKTINNVAFNTVGTNVTDKEIDDIIVLKSTNSIAFAGVVETSLSTLGAPFKLVDGTVIMATGDYTPIVISDSVSENNYKVMRTTDGTVYSEFTEEIVTPNNYVYDEVTGRMYKIVSSNGYLDIEEI